MLKVLTLMIALALSMAMAVFASVAIFYKATARPVHASAADVPVQAPHPADRRFAAAAAEATRLARELTASANLPGLSVAVGVDDELIWTGAFGWADVEAAQPMSPDTRIRIGTASKALTSAAVGLLLERGLVDIDAPVQRYVPGFPPKRKPIESSLPIPAPLQPLLQPTTSEQVTVTTRHAMAHTSGIRHHRSEEDSMPRQHCETVTEALARFSDHPLRFAPGTAQRFSSNGWVLVSAVVEQAAGMPFNEFMASELFAPLGMHSTVPDNAPGEMAKRAAFYHPRANRDTSYGLEHPGEIDTSCFAGAGQYLSTPSDLVRFGLAMENRRLFGEETTAELETPITLPSGKSHGYGLGWHRETVPFGEDETVVLGHRGTIIGGSARLMRFPAHRIVVAVASNVSDAELGPLGAEVARVFAAARAGDSPRAERAR